MARNSLEAFAHALGEDWGPLSTDVVAAASAHLKRLLQAPSTESWLEALHRNAPASDELYRDPRHGFVLLAHTEPAGLYRPPHDHGRSWVVYGVQLGVSEMTTYARVTDANGTTRLVKRGSTLVHPGELQVYLPGDIHDTRCVMGPALLYRFTERDLKKEDAQEHRITRYVERDGGWVAP